MRVTFLGTGTSVGVPRIGCHCAVCRSPDPRNQRLRCSILMQEGDQHVLVDTPPDLRTQALRFGVERVDAVVFTHAHADHLHGLDDVRCFCLERDAPLPCYADERTAARIRHVFDYAFVSGHVSSVPQLSVHLIDGPFAVGNLRVQPVPVCHGRLPVLAFRVGGFAYATDCSSIPPESVEQLRGLDTLVLDALRLRPHPTHFCLEQALAAVEALSPRQAFLTHIAHDLEHTATSGRLPSRVRLAYDGLVLEVD